MIIVEYDPRWPDSFELLRQRIWPTICDLATSIEHVGSTSVVGLSAKPVIDMTILVKSVDEMPQVIERLSTLGYLHRGDLGVVGREAFESPVADPRHHLYACVADTTPLRNHLAIRDHLRKNPSVAKEYGELKKALAARFESDIDGYVDGKTSFLLEILKNSGLAPSELKQIETNNSRRTPAVTPISEDQT